MDGSMGVSEDVGRRSRPSTGAGIDRKFPTLTGDESFDVEQSVVQDWFATDQDAFAQFVRSRSLVDAERMIDAVQRTRQEHARRIEYCADLENRVRAVVRATVGYGDNESTAMPAKFAH